MHPSLPVSNPSPLLPFLFDHQPDVKRTKIRLWLKHGAIRVNTKIVTRHDHPLLPGDTVVIDPQPKPAPGPRLPRGLRILHEDDSLVVIEKPANLLSIASKAEQEHTAYAHLTDHVRQTHRGRGARIWIVHRLDRETSGLMVFARTESAKRTLQGAWDRAEKRYLAIADGLLPAPQGTLRSDLDESNPYLVRATVATEATREAITHYRVLQVKGQRSLVELTLVTGRRHQIRVQLAEVGCPVLGDPKYHPQPNKGLRLCLHSSFLRLPHPDTKALLTFESPLPEAMKQLL